MADLMAEAEQTARELVACAGAAGLTVATAESCTAGMVASTIADIPGASEVLRGGAVTYVNEIKHRVLSVSRETLDGVGAVSSACACEMAQGARRVFETDVAVSVTGFAGPGGGTPEEPVGTVYIGLAWADDVRAERCRFTGDRTAVRQAACLRACEHLLGACRELGDRGVVSFQYLEA